MTALILLVIIIAFGIYFLFYAKNICKRLEWLLNTADHGSFEEAKSIWFSKTTLFSCFAPHEHIDKISEAFNRASVRLECGSKEEYYAEVQTIICGLHVLANYDVPSLRSIF